MMLINIFSVLLDTTNDKTYIANLASPEAAPGIMVSQFNRGVESSTISFFNFSILGSFLTIQNIFLETYTTMINELILTDTCYILQTFCLCWRCQKQSPLCIFLCFLILIYFIEFDILGTKIKNKRKNYFFGNKGLLVFF